MARHRKRSLTHAGAVPFRRAREPGGEAELLFVEASRHPGVWVFPKGHLAPGESVDVAAAREAEEEAGVIGQVTADLGVDTFTTTREVVRVAWRLLRVEKEGPSPENRRKRWLCRLDALAASPFPEQRTLVERACTAIAAAR